MPGLVTDREVLLPGIELEPWSRALPILGRAALFPLGKKEPRLGTPPVRYMRALTMVFGLAQILILVVLLQLQVPPSDPPPPQWPIWLWAGLTLSSLVAYWGFRRARTRGIVAAASPADALLRYRERLMLSIAYAEVPALVAFIAFFEAETLVPYVVTLPASLLLIIWAAPRAGDVRDLQKAIAERGGTLDLAAVLMGT